MIVSGFTIVRNAVRFEYPVVESIRSILPLVDEFVVAVGDCDDGTEELIASIGSKKLRVIKTIWDDTVREGGTVMAQQTNLAFDVCEGDWCFYLQADEVIHENDLDRIQHCMQKNLARPAIEGLNFRYHHFRADYSIRDPLPYRSQIRIVRPGIGVSSVGDACGFALDGRKLKKASTGAWVYHYGYVKPPANMSAKSDYFSSLYDGRSLNPEDAADAADAAYEWNLRTCELFTGSHPRVMNQRIADKDWVTPTASLVPRWKNINYWKGLTNKNTRTFQRWYDQVTGGSRKAA